jgi:hypothetical protein
MVGTVGLTLDAPDAGPLPPPPTGVPEPAGAPPGLEPGQAAGGPAGPPQLPAVIPLPPPLPYARDPGSYTELWTRQTRSTAGIEMEEQIDSWLNQYSNVPTDYGVLVSGITSAADWIGFLTVFKGNVISLVHSLGQFRTGLGTASPGNGRTFGLVGERVGTGPAPIIMVPSTGGLAAWVRPIELHEPSEAELETLRGSAERTMDKPIVQGDATKDEDPDHPFVEVTNLCFIPKAWAAYFLDQCSPYEAYQRYKKLITTVPGDLQPRFRYLEAWLKASCLRGSVNNDDSLLTANWQAPVIDRKVNTWMERHTQYVNAMPFGEQLAAPATPAAASLDPQMCFDKAMETIAALKPTAELKKYSIAESQRLRAACSLSVSEMTTCLPGIYQSLLTEGRSKRGTEAVLANALKPTADNDDPGLIYISPELVADIRDCKYGLGWDTSHRNCHRGISPFAVPHMSLRHQQERQVIQDRMGQASSTTTDDVERAESKPSPAPKDYHGLLQLLSNYIRLLKAVAGLKCKHLEEVTAIRRTLRSRVDLFIDVKTREIIFILWAIFLDAREFFSHQIEDASPVPESSLKYTSAFLSLGRIPSDILGVPLEQFGERSSYPSNITRDSGGGRSNGDMFRPADFIAAENLEIPDDISTLTGSLLDKYPSVTAEQIMSFGALKYDDLRVGQRGACLNQNLLGRCSNPKCTYIHASAKPTVQRAKEVAAKLGPAIDGFMKSKESRTGAKRKRRPGPAASV